jgi:transposase InsO family protein
MQPTNAGAAGRGPHPEPASDERRPSWPWPIAGLRLEAWWCGPFLNLRHHWTRPYRPQTNGKAERFIRTCLAEWAYARSYPTSVARASDARRGVDEVHPIPLGIAGARYEAAKVLGVRSSASFDRPT